MTYSTIIRRVVKPPRLSWADLVALGPELRCIERRARDLRHSWPNYSRLKCQLSRLVGFGARQVELRSSEAYELAMSRIVAALELPPPRRNRRRRPSFPERNGGAGDGR